MQDAKSGTSTGVSAFDRGKTVLALSSPHSTSENFRKPGHVFPLKYRNGGVLRRAGHTEASVDLVMLAGLRPVSVLSAVVDPIDYSIASLSILRKLALEYSLPIVSITDLIRYCITSPSSNMFRTSLAGCFLADKCRALLQISKKKGKNRRKNISFTVAY